MRSGVRLITIGAAAAAAAAATGTLGACGSGSSDDPAAAAAPAAATSQQRSLVERARARVTGARRPLTRFTGPATSPGKPPAGKTIVSIYSVPAPWPTRAAKSVVPAAKAVGWQVKVVNGRGNPAGWAAAVDTAITSGASAIVFSAVAPSQIAPQVERAKRAGIPFVAIGGCESSPPPGVVNQVDPPQFDAGYRLGQWLVARSPGGARILALDSPSFPCLKQGTTGFKKAIEEAGSSYRIVATAASPATDVTTPAGAQRMAAMMRAHPEARYFWTMAESWAPSLLQATQATGRTDVTGMGTDSDFFAGHIANGAPFALAAPDTLGYGWYAVDALIRWFNQKPAVKYRVPFRILDSGNAASAGGPAVKDDFDFASAWKRLWGLSR